MFHSNGHRFLVTYSSLLPSDADDGEVQSLIDCFTGYASHCDRYLACLEKHEDGTYHIHMYLFYYRTIRVDGERYFDVVGFDGRIFHPNVEKIGGRKRDHDQVINYVMKAGTFWGDLKKSDHMTRDEVYEEARVMGSSHKARALIQSRCGRDWWVSHGNIEATLSFLFPPPPPPLYVSPFVFYAVPAPLLAWELHMEEPGRHFGLVLYGPTRTGKSSWARSLGRHNYWKGAFNVNAYDAEAKYNVFDDLDDFRSFKYKSWMGNDPFTVSGKYLKERRIDPKPCIFICNQLPAVKLHSDFDWWISNTIRYRVDVPIR